MKNHWWKILGVLLLTYSIIVGLSAKVGPGITDVKPDHVVASSSDSIIISGYNTSFDQGDNVVRLKRGKFILQSNKTKVIDKKTLVAYFNIPKEIPDSIFNQNLTVLVENKIDGVFGSFHSFKIKPSDQSYLSEISASKSTKAIHKQKKYFAFPFKNLLHETIRNLNFHVPMWFTMITLMILSFSQSLKSLKTQEAENDIKANAYASVGVLFGIAGIVTGAFWARFTWGPFWTNDPKLNGAAIGVMIYAAYLILRSSIEEPEKRARISATYNVFAFPIFIVLILIYPKLAGYSLHPGSGDSVGFDTYDLDNSLRKVFYPAVLGWILLSIWIAQLKSRIDKLEWKIEE